MANYPYELVQDAAYQSHTGPLTRLWFVPKLAQGLNTSNSKYIYMQILIYIYIYRYIYIYIYMCAIPLRFTKNF